MDDEKGTGTFPVSYDLIADVMTLPTGTVITSIEPAEFNPITCVFVVEHADLPKDRVATLNPHFRRVYQSAVEFEGWGMKDTGG